jgi:serine protease Do
MEELSILETVERYIRGEMLPEERVFFEQLRKDNPSVDQMVVEHTIFLSQLSGYGEQKEFKSQLHETHKELVRSGEIKEQTPAKLVFLWKKYKRVVFVAATIAGITALGISGLISYVSPKVNNAQVEQLSRRITATQTELSKVARKVNQGARVTTDNSAPREDVNFTAGGTGFLIDAKGYIVTNAHVVKNATRIAVQNSKGEYNARIIRVDADADLAVLKIEDSSFHASSPLTYSISRTGADLAEKIFTLGYPRDDEIVYGEGYVSARTGHDGDTLTCQLAVAANPGNSGTPVLNGNGEVIGIVSTREPKAQGVVFATRSKYIFRVIDEMRTDSALYKTDSTIVHIKMPLSSSIKGMDRTAQIKKIQDCIFIVKSNEK